MRAALLLGAVLLSGCASEPSGGLIALDLDAARPLDVLPDPTMLPAGFHVGITQSLKGDFPHLVDGASRVLERGDPVERQRIATGALLFETPEHAERTFDEITRSPSGESGFEQVELGDEAVYERNAHEHDERGGASTTAVVRAGAYVLWVNQDAQGAPPAVDALEVARGMLERTKR